MASVQKELVATHFNNIIRLIHQVDRERVLWLRNVSFNTLRRLGVKRDVSRAIGKLPAGSDQCDLGSIRTWMDKVQPTDLVAVAQVVAIDATAVSRTG